MADPLKFGSGFVKIFTEKVLGVGSYGKVYKAKCGQLPCAAKLLHETMMEHDNTPGSNDFVKKFEQECQFLSAIKHPNIVQYLCTSRDEESGRPALVMELMDVSLTKFLEGSAGPIPYHTQLNICHDVALALDYLHSNSIIHRDLSSNNVLLIGAGSRAKVTDFGMSKLTDMNPRMTPVTLCPGTLVYMPPEVFTTASHYSYKLDCFSFGVLAVQIITRNTPNPGKAGDYVKDPKYPTGRVVVQFPEVTRRKSDIDLIDADHPLLPVALDCLKDIETERPSADDLCEELASMKEEPRYLHSRKHVTDHAVSIQGLELEVEAKERVIEDYQRKMEEYQVKIETKDQECQRMVEEFQREIQKKEEEYLSSLQLKEEQYKRDLEVGWSGVEMLNTVEGLKHRIRRPDTEPSLSPDQVPQEIDSPDIPTVQDHQGSFFSCQKNFSLCVIVVLSCIIGFLCIIIATEVHLPSIGGYPEELPSTGSFVYLSSRTGYPSWSTPKEDLPLKKEDQSVNFPKTENPSVNSPKIGDSSVHSPKKEDLSVHLPRTENPSVNSPKKEDSSVHSLTKGDSSVHSPKKEDLSVHLPKTENLSVHAPKKEDSSVHLKKTENPSVNSPKKEDLSVHLPKTENPSVNSPKKDDSSMHTPKKEAPSVHSPEKEDPSMDLLKTEDPSNTSHVHSQMTDCCQVSKQQTQLSMPGNYRLIIDVCNDPTTFCAPGIFACCDMKTAGGKWMVIQRRINGSVDFYRGWTDYVNGFGDLDGEFWYGLEKIHCLTTQDDVELRIELGHGKKPTMVWTYQRFHVSGAETNYVLTIGEGHGVGGEYDSMAYHNGVPFSTPDKDNDGSYNFNCASAYGGAWWHDGCFKSNLNGKHDYHQPVGDKRIPTPGANRLCWYDGHDNFIHFTHVQMMIRPKRCTQ